MKKYGKMDTGEINWLFRCGIIINLVLSALICSALFFFDKPVICIFNSDTELVQTASKALPLFSLSFIPMALNLIYTSFLYSTKRTKQSNVIAVSRGIIIKAMAICSIPMLFGKEMIWVAPFIAETITLIIAIIITKHTKLIYKEFEIQFAGRLRRDQKPSRICWLVLTLSCLRFQQKTLTGQTAVDG